MPNAALIATTAGIAAGAALVLYLWRRTRKPSLLYCLNVKLCVKPHRRDEFLQAIAHDERHTLRDEPDAVRFLHGEDYTTPNTFYLHEEYTSKAGFEAHCRTPHFAVWQAFCESDPFTLPVEVAFYTAAPGTAPLRPPCPHVYCTNVKMRVRPERRSEFLAAIKADQAGVLSNEPLALAFLVGEDTSTPNTFYLHEQFAGKAGFDAHLKAPHFPPWQAFVDSQPFSEPLQGQHYGRCWPGPSPETIARWEEAAQTQSWRLTMNRTS